jgi:hypothetical protein
MFVIGVWWTLLTPFKYKVPTGDAEEEAIASRALHSKEHKDFANCEYSSFTSSPLADPINLVKKIVHDLY